jgi:hypothetical protein
MIWVGGAQGAGKSTISWRLSRAHDLPLHPVDLWAYDHQGRLPGGDSLDDELARGPAGAADAFEGASLLRLGLVLDDVRGRGLGSVPALVEGPQLSPELAGPLPAGWCVWLVPDPERTRLAREERVARARSLAGPDTSTGGDRVGRLVERDAVIAGRVRTTAADAGRTVIAVPAQPDWAAIKAAVESALTPALRTAPRLAPGPELGRQRRYENAAAVVQGRRWRAAAGLATAPAYPFGCECGTSRCRAVWTATADEYASRTSGGRPLDAHASQRYR